MTIIPEPNPDISKQQAAHREQIPGCSILQPKAVPFRTRLFQYFRGWSTDEMDC
jgi:hypothetical protein